MAEIFFLPSAFSGEIVPGNEPLDATAATSQTYEDPATGEPLTYDGVTERPSPDSDSADSASLLQFPQHPL